MRLLRPAPLALLLLTGCMGSSLGPPVSKLPECISDDQCGEGQVCFADGCGDPGKDLVAEVVVSSQNGHLEQDLDQQSLDVKGFTPLYAAPPMAFNVTVLRPATLGGEPVPYLDRVTLRAEGRSDKLPGIQRSYGTSATPSNGLVKLPVGAGVFTLTTTPALASIPPVALLNQQVNPGDSRKLTVTLPHQDELYRVDGQLVRSATGPVLITSETGMDVRALDAQTLRPLSQKIPVSITTGHFRLLVDKSVNAQRSFLIEATPRDPKALIPTKRFLVSVMENLTAPLEMGEYGAPVTVTGTLVGSDNNHVELDGGSSLETAPIAGAVVYVEGTVEGGGSFRSQNAVTGADGRFALGVLPSSAKDPLRLVAVPPPSHYARVLRKAISVEPGEPGAPVDLGTFECLDRVTVTGVVYTPRGSVAAGVKVRAVPVSTAALEDATTLADAMDTVTDDSGMFTLLLDGATYRMDMSSPDYPLTSRFLTVEVEVGTNGYGTKTPPPREFVLSSGRSVKGTVFWRDPTRGAVPAPYATIRLFRVGTSGGAPVSIPLAEGISDPNGNYTLLMPTR